MKAQKLRITQVGWETYTGHLQGIMFTNGLSDDLVSPTIAMRMGSVIGIVGVDEQEAVGLGANMVKNDKAKAPIAPVVVVPQEDNPVDPTLPPLDASLVAKTKYTREDLEAVADRDGIAGLRAIAEGYNVKGRGILELITEIIKAQETY